MAPPPSPASSDSLSEEEIQAKYRPDRPENPGPAPAPPPFIDDFAVPRLVLAALALSALAIVASALMWPLLIGELDELSVMARREGKQFKEMADNIWHELMHIQQHHPMPQAERARRELQMLPSDSRGFLDRLERRSYKGRQRMKTTGVVEPGEQPAQPQFYHQSPYWELYTKRSGGGRTTEAALPEIELHAEQIEDKPTLVTSATTIESTTTTTMASSTTRRMAAAQIDEMPFRARGVPLRNGAGYGAEEKVTSSSSISDSQANQRVFPTNCPRGPPGHAGKPGYDGLPGIPGVPGQKGQTGDEVQKQYDIANSACVRCPAGPPGLPGGMGPPGAPGESGTSGVPGTVANKASAGRPGPVGDAGAPGANGSPGQPGKPGSPGIKYTRGPSGPKGQLGKAGEPGAPGENGPDGRPGTAGEPGFQGWPGAAGPAGKPGNIGPEGERGIPGAERLYCNCPVRSSQLMRLRDQPGGVNALLGRWKGRLPSQLLSEYESYTAEKDKHFRTLREPEVEAQNGTSGQS